MGAFHRSRGTGLANRLTVVHFFTIGSNVIKWELHPMTPTGPYRLAVYHPGGPVVEYFDSAIDALVREGEIEDALLTDRSRTPIARATELGSA